VPDIVINETDFVRLVAKVKTLELVFAAVFEPAIDELNGVAGIELRFTTSHEEGSVLHKHSFGKVGVVRKKGVSITNRKDGWNQLYLISLADPLELIQTMEVIGVLFGKRVQPKGTDNPIDSMEAGRLDHAGNLGHVVVRVQPPFRKPSKAIRVRFNCAEFEGETPETGQQD
jgi:hypothetical protein